MKKSKSENKTPVQAADKNSPVLLITVIIVGSIFFLVACLGWGMYFFQKRKNKQLKTQEEILQSQIATLPGVYSPGNDNTVPSDNLANKVLDEAPTQSENICSTCGSSNSATNPEEEVKGFLPPSTSEKNTGYIKKVYVKGGKNFLDIDYIQWLYGVEAEKAMREDGKCPKTGECVVLNDYYIRNQNPLVRTFEIAPDVEIRTQTLDAEITGNVNQNRVISLDKLKEIFTSQKYKQRYEYVPFIVEVGNQKIQKITEQYIP